ncbi:hypothetical protein SDC9_151370 [bioreactor metagenome]|uniref:GGDEF domain-containing protein n=1 Tax=bioreactor metagenome TaxID=1076179 RepID=A0A645EUG6_9ZZZZ
MQSNKLLVSITGQILQWIVVVDRRTMDWLFVSREIDEALHDPNSHGQLLRWMNRQAQALSADEESANAELELTGRYGTQFFSVTVYPLHWHARSALAFVLTDVSSEKQHLCRLQEAAWYDTLTKVYNRFYGMEVLERWLKERADFVLCFVDIDNLKVVNDGFGHREGDHYILDIARGLQEFSEDAIVCRIGGDEFLLLAKGWRAEAAGTRMEELRSALVSRGKQTERAYERGMSYGIVAVEADCTLTAEQLLGLADERMYEYKRLHSCGPEAAPKAKQ